VHTCGRYEAKRFDVRRWVPLFERAGVPLVLNGHDHNYQRLEDGPVTYVVIGGGGAKLYDLRRCPETGLVSLAGESRNSFLYLQATEERIDAAALAPDGQTLDRFSVA
jgi:tartrate-resistant acid phosphatase type 5